MSFSEFLSIFWLYKTPTLFFVIIVFLILCVETQVIYEEKLSSRKINSKRQQSIIRNTANKYGVKESDFSPKIKKSIDKVQKSASLLNLFLCVLEIIKFSKKKTDPVLYVYLPLLYKFIWIGAFVFYFVPKERMSFDTYLEFILKPEGWMFALALCLILIGNFIGSYAVKIAGEEALVIIKEENLLINNEEDSLSMVIAFEALIEWNKFTYFFVLSSEISNLRN